MKTVICTYTRFSPNSVVASNRIANWLSTKYGFKLLDNAEDLKENIHNEEIENIIIVNGIPTFCGFREELYSFIETQAARGRNVRFFWVGQDYNPSMRLQSGQIRAVKENNCEFILLSAFDIGIWGEYANNVTSSHYINWNMFTYDKEPELETEVVDSLLYYGALRRNRMVKLSKYLIGARGIGLDFTFAMTSGMAWKGIDRSMNEIAHSDFGIDDYTINTDISNQPGKFHPSNIIKSISGYSHGLYIEDDTGTTPIFTSPANRWYEMLSSGTNIMIDSYSKRTFETEYRSAAHILDPLYIKDKYDALDRMKSREFKDICQECLSHFKKDYRAELDSAVDHIFKQYELI